MIVSENDLAKLIIEGLASRPENYPVKMEATSIGLHLGAEFLRYKNIRGPVPLPSALDTERIPVNQDGAIDFSPGACVLACSLERIRMPLGCMGFIQTKGTIARGFVTVHLCDGQIDPGFEGRITLELVNLSHLQYVLKPGIEIAQLYVHRLTQVLKQGYSGRYQFASGPTAMRDVSPPAEPTDAPNTGSAGAPPVSGS